VGAIDLDYDDDPGRFAAAVSFRQNGDVHPYVAERLATAGTTPVLELGGATGPLARTGIVPTVVVDIAMHVAGAPRPAVRADARRLPFADGSFGAVAALWMLYHLDDPVQVLRESWRVLRPGGLFAASAPSRYNDPELAAVLPRYGQELTFDAEDAEEVVGRVFTVEHVTRWDRPSIDLPDQEALIRYLRGRGVRATGAEVGTPLRLTKRGCVVWARKTNGATS
jgi:SAM-dependent methyltransferase